MMEGEMSKGRKSKRMMGEGKKKGGKVGGE